MWAEVRQGFTRITNLLRRMGSIDGSYPQAGLSCRICSGIDHLFVIRVEDRVQLQKHLGEAHIGTAIHYPVPLHLQKAYASLNFGVGSFPITEKCAAEIVSLPMFPGLSYDNLKRVAESVLEFVNRPSSHQRLRFLCRCG